MDTTSVIDRIKSALAKSSSRREAARQTGASYDLVRAIAEQVGYSRPRPTGIPAHIRIGRARWAAVKARRDAIKAEMLAAQQGKCTFCYQALLLDNARLDHNHATGFIRGVICHGCRIALSAVQRGAKVSALNAELAGVYLARPDSSHPY